MQVFEHEAMVRVMAGASPARSFQRQHGSFLRRRQRQLSAADRITSAVTGNEGLMSHIRQIIIIIIIILTFVKRRKQSYKGAKGGVSVPKAIAVKSNKHTTQRIN